MEDRRMKFLLRGRAVEVRTAENRVTVSIDGAPARTFPARVQGRTVITPAGPVPFALARDRGGLWVAAGGFADFLAFPRPGPGPEHPAGEVRAPLTGRLLSVRVRPGDVVQKGDCLAILSAMKMECRLDAPRDGTVASVACAAGALVEQGTVLFVLTPGNEPMPQPPPGTGSRRTRPRDATT
jgi:biotin carboxyl carrier protein